MSAGGRGWAAGGLAAAGVLALVLFVLHATAGPVGARPAVSYDPCPGQQVKGWMGDSIGKAISFPSLERPAGIRSYQGSIYRPRRDEGYRGRRPLVLLQHGINGDQCRLYWVARELAGHGFITMAWTSPSGGSSEHAFRNGLDATRSALAFAHSRANPLRRRTNLKRIGLGGHSMGSIIVSYAQQDRAPGVRAIVASDNLRHWVRGDPGGAIFECAQERALPITPRVPALGFAKDDVCRDRPEQDSRKLKQPGFRRWRRAGEPSMELVMRGFEHGSFTDKGTNAQRRRVGHYWLAWMRRWVEGRRHAIRGLLTRRVLGRPTRAVLSSHFDSGAFLEPRVDTGNLRRWLRHYR